MFCANCGKNIPEGSNICPECGTLIAPPSKPAVKVDFYDVLSIVNVSVGGLFALLTFIFTITGAFSLVNFCGPVIVAACAIIAFALLKSEKGNKLVNLIALCALGGTLVLAGLIQFGVGMSAISKYNRYF